MSKNKIVTFESPNQLLFSFMSDYADEVVLSVNDYGDEIIFSLKALEAKENEKKVQKKKN